MHSNANDEHFTSIDKEIFQLSKAPTPPTIYKVHRDLRDVNNKAHEPELIAIGPYRRGKDNLKMMEVHKLRYLQLLLQRKNENNVERYISAIRELEQQARNCYAEPISLNADEFIEMLVLDGCFIIELLRKSSMIDATYRNDPIFQMDWIMKTLQRDLILFENQIPFFVLCKLFDLIEGPNQHNRLIYLVLNFCQSLYPGVVHPNRRNWNAQETKHLLDLLHHNWISSTYGHVYLDVDVEQEGFRLIHSAAELTHANVRFAKRESHTVFDVAFDKGIMLMSPFKIDNRAESVFRNLVAYEQYSPNGLNLVTNFVQLLDCLINTSRDVEILSECGIIVNHLGDNDKIANLFNHLTDSVIGPSKRFFYAATTKGVDAHYKQRWNREVGVLIQDHLNSYWGYVAIGYAIVILVLTVVQTVCSVLQASGKKKKEGEEKSVLQQAKNQMNPTASLIFPCDNQRGICSVHI